MSETRNISDIAEKVSRELFGVFGWQRSTGPLDTNWPCATKSHGAATHSSDVVYWYDDPYSEDRLQLKLDTWLERIVDRTERCVVLGAEVIGHTVSNTVAATVLVSGSSEVRPALRKLIDARNPEF